MNSLLLKNGRVIDPHSGQDRTADVLIEGAKIAAVEPNLAAKKGSKIIDLKDKVICPGLIDSHVHLREPGQSAKETIATGAAAAARGGFTSILCMPNTNPAIDNAGTVALIREKAARESSVNVYVSGAITRNINGEELAPFGSLKQAGVIALTDDGHCVQNGELMRRALEYVRMFDLPVLDHCQDYSLVSDGVMHEGYWSTLLGLRGWPSAGEETIVARNILLARETGAHVHCQHLSAWGSVQLIRQAKEEGIPISGEACPHHFTLTDAAVAGSTKFWEKDGAELLAAFPEENKTPPSWPCFDTNLKMNPPLRSAKDRQAIIDGLRDGSLEIIGSDHAPHSDFEKEVEFDYAPFGITGLETEVSLSLGQLYHSGLIKLIDLLAKWTINPARMLRLNKGQIKVGADADITVLDLEKRWVFTRQSTASKSLNSPFYDWPMRGKSVMTIVAGAIVWDEQNSQAGV